MAIWQFECNIIFDEKYSCNLGQKNMEYQLYNIEFLRKEESWCDDIVQYGKTEETCIEFFLENGRIEEIKCRLDLRSLSKQTFFSLLDYVKRNRAMFLIDNKKYPPDEKIMLEIIKNSKANEFCKAPLEFLGSLNEL